MEAIGYDRKIAKKIFPQNYSVEMEKINKGLQSENVEAKERGALEEGEADSISFEIFLFMCQSALKSGDSLM